MIGVPFLTGKNVQHLETQRPPRPGRVRFPPPVRRSPQGALEDGTGNGDRAPEPEPHEAERRIQGGEQTDGGHGSTSSFLPQTEKLKHDRNI